VLSTLLALPNIVVSSVSADQPVITRAMVERVMQLRHNRDLFFIDLGVPRNVEAGVADLYNVYLYNIDDLSEIVEQNRHAREREIPRAEAIVEEHVRRFEEWHAGAHAMELLALLRQKLEHEREAFLREHLGTLEHLTAEDRRRAERLSRELLEHVIQARDTTSDAAHDSRREVEPVAAARALVGLLREKS
jgi:glutamyl-tRNA reductase